MIQQLQGRVAETAQSGRTNQPPAVGPDVEFNMIPELPISVHLLIHQRSSGAPDKNLALKHASVNMATRATKQNSVALKLSLQDLLGRIVPWV